MYAVPRYHGTKIASFPHLASPPPIPVVVFVAPFFRALPGLLVGPARRWCERRRWRARDSPHSPCPMQRVTTWEVRRQWRPAKDVPVMKIRNPAVPSHEPGRISIQEGDRHRKGSPRPLCLIPSPHPPPLCCPSSPKPRTSPPASIESTHTAKESTAIMSDSKNFETLQLHAGYVLPQARGNSFN